ncbi:MAG: glycosyltransferase family 2 protein [Gemmataceae bacterium]
MLTAISAISFALAVVPAILYAVNRFLYRPAPPTAADLPSVSVLIPARNEESSIGLALDAVLASRGVDFEAIVLDDHSEDRTCAVAQDYASRDPRVRVEHAPPLPDGWSGKQHACFALSQLATHPILVFVDADVRLAPDGLARLTTFLRDSGAGLVSGVPRQEMGTLLEKLVLPLIHFLLLGYLPLVGMRWTRLPAFGAGCGQLFAARRDAYEFAGGHKAIRSSRHDGVTLPRAFRRAGHATDLCDATDLATCRMYRTGRELWLGLAKNAREGLAAPAALVPWTLILGLGQVAPLVLVVMTPGDWLGWLALAAGYAVRLDAAVQFRQSWLGAALHPLGVLALLTIQWYAAVRAVVGKPVVWKGRPYLATD